MPSFSYSRRQLGIFPFGSFAILLANSFVRFVKDLGP